MADSCSFPIHCTSPLLWDCGGTAAAARGGNCWRSQRKHFSVKNDWEVVGKEVGDGPIAEDVQIEIK